MNNRPGKNIYCILYSDKGRETGTESVKRKTLIFKWIINPQVGEGFSLLPRRMEVSIMSIITTADARRYSLPLITLNVQPWESPLGTILFKAAYLDTNKCYGSASFHKTK